MVLNQFPAIMPDEVFPMANLLIRSRSGPDGKLHLEVPVSAPNTEFDIELVVRPHESSTGEWPAGYFDLFGSISDETFVRPPQGELPSAADIP
ncbi:MAG TPA: hypothetical protein DDY91_03125 [Planctomycetaceae bacterium]|nr:hypothetical protein [Planctomycetaceae bacterium]